MQKNNLRKRENLKEESHAKSKRKAQYVNLPKRLFKKLRRKRKRITLHI